MNSFISAKPKHLFGIDTKLWIIFCTTLVILFLFLDLIIMIQSGVYRDRITHYKDETKLLQTQSNTIQREINFVQKQEKLGNDAKNRNILIRDSLKNLFDLIPDQITLSKTHIDAKSIVLYGLTPSKDVYNFMLRPPLESIFNESNVVFYALGNGWFRFVSTNRAKEGLIYE
jgi:hypothetical protein